MSNNMNRRTFLGAAAASTAAFSIIPRHVLGGPGYVAPSDKLTLAYIGCGTQGFREMVSLLANPGAQIVAVCDPNRDSNDYVDWSKDEIRNLIRKNIGKPGWREGARGIPGGRDVARELVDGYYATSRAAEKFRGCTAYADFRELLEKEKDLDGVKIMTPDHLHATIAIAAMKKGKHVVVHKPLANRLQEARLVIDAARQSKVGTHFLPASDGQQVRVIADWIRKGAIGTLREIHNWSYRPVWPQYPTLPTDKPPVPEGLDWDLWLGPALDRPYHPNYTHAVFRGWYEFGGGSIADMGHYSLWPVFVQFNLDAPVSVESTPSHVCSIVDQVSKKILNDFSFPMACTVRFKFAAKAGRPALEMYWYDGSMKPRTPDEVEAEKGELESEGLMFVGDKGRIIGDFRGANPKIYPAKRRSKYEPKPAAGAAQQRPRSQGGGERDKVWVEGFKAGKPTYGDFLLAGPISETVNLAAISLRLGGKRLLWNSASGKITNLPEANKYLTREYRKGWEL